jgi:hypothetical protein
MSRKVNNTKSGTVLLADRLEKGVGLQQVRRRVQRARCLARKWLLQKRREDIPHETHGSCVAALRPTNPLRRERRFW